MLSYRSNPSILALGRRGKEKMVTYPHRDGVNQHAATELDNFNDELQAALLMSISECVISWTTCVPGFWKYAIYSGTRRG